MSFEKWQIGYLGHEEKFIDSIRIFSKKTFNQDIDIVTINQGPSVLTNFALQKSPAIIYVDFTALTDTESIQAEILYIKKINQCKGILLCAILGDAFQQKEHLLLFTSGFQLSYIKGSELDSFLAQSFYIGFGATALQKEFALAKDLEIDLEVGVCSTLTLINEIYFTIETDISTNKDNLRVDFDLIEGLTNKSFEILDHFRTALFFPMTYSYQLNFPYASPWDDVTEDTIQEETIETWIDLNKEEVSSKNSLIIFTSNTSIYTDLLPIMNSLPAIDFNISEDFEELKVKEQLRASIFDIILFDINDNHHTLQNLATLIHTIRQTENYDPIVIAFATPSKTEALQKLYQYQQILSVNEKLSPTLLELFVNTYTLKKREKGKNLFFPHKTPQRAIKVLHEITILALSEQEVFFASKLELPYFSVLHFSLPVDCFVTIIPKDDPPISASQSDLYRYTGIIHGIPEESRKRLRKFVNQIIYEPVAELSLEIVEEKLAQTLKNVHVEEEDSEAPSASPSQENNSKADVIISTNKKFSINGKSKL